ncbi:hypothetical protein OG418_19100 [Streptomyces phaeochromogenes]|uniref:hypothetical protein n=1 Tax=Streptomyces phaeochromogenes TaxID=1923 RepID=UPI00324ACD4E
MSSPLPVLNKENLVNGLSFVIPGLKETDNGVLLPRAVPLSGGRSVERLSNQEIDGILTKLNSAVSRNASSFQWVQEAEFSIISLEARGAFDRFFEDKQFTGQGENPITYKIGKPSKEFTAYLLCVIAQQSGIRKTPRWIMIRRRAATLAEGGQGSRFVELLTGDSVLDFVAEIIQVTTLQVSAVKDVADFELLANSFLFHAAYNLDAAARIGVDSHFEVRSIQRGRRSQSTALDAPRQSYNVDLVHHYLMGVAAEIPLLEYLSYYHVVEHFFQKVFNDDLVEQVRKGITDPSFSARRARDIQGIIKTVDKATRQAREEGGFNEQRALQLVLERFVSVTRLVADLDSYDGGLVGYYASNDVPFAGAGKVTLRLPNEDDARGALARRIYRVRNALVHAKEGDLPKYAPFAHDGELAREIPLMRFVAEQVIIAHGKAL